MRKAFVPVKTRKAALNRCPWASKVVKVEGGYQCFESVTDYEVWRNQN